MKAQKTQIPNLMVLEPSLYKDSRGFFFEAWNESTFERLDIKTNFKQDNQSRSARGVVRGLHYQLTAPQGKYVRVLNGAIFDVAIDLRRSSQTFGDTFGINLSSQNMLALWIPPGFAHGFMSLSEDTDVLYKCTEFYSPNSERTIIWNDPDLNIKWPDIGSIAISRKDACGVRFKDAEYFP